MGNGKTDYWRSLVLALLAGIVRVTFGIVVALGVRQQHAQLPVRERHDHRGMALAPPLPGASAAA